MRISRSTMAMAVVSAFSTFACSSSDGSGDDTGTGMGSGSGIVDGDPRMGDTVGPVVGDCDPNAEIPCVVGIAEPCGENYDSGFPDDDYCRAAPDPALGMQVHVGPDDYSDPAQIEQYVILPGQETNWAEVVQFPNTTDVYTRGYRSYMRPGSHHFIMFGTAQGDPNGPIQNGSGAESAVGIGGRFLGGATKSIQNIDTQTEFPEDQGIGSQVPANSFVAMNLHFINTKDEPLLQEIWVNFIYIPEDEVTQFVKPITWYGGIGMNIPPGTHTVLSNAAAPCSAPGDLRVGMMTAHAHANTLRVTTRMNDSLVLFEDYDWAEPTEWRYTRAVDNPAPNPELSQSGGYSGVLNATAADTFVWECEIQNRSDSYLTFSNQVYTGEMCNVFGYYITPDPNAANWGCGFF